MLQIVKSTSTHVIRKHAFDPLSLFRNRKIGVRGPEVLKSELKFRHIAYSVIGYTWLSFRSFSYKGEREKKKRERVC